MTARNKPPEIMLPGVTGMPHALHYLEEAFGSGGWLSGLPGFQPREEQFKLSNRIASALLMNRDLVAESPTGTGKSMAYLVPAAYHSAATGKRTMVVTANITLQEQLIRKDLPALRSILPWDFRYCLIKGKSNYLCLRAHDKYVSDSKFHLRTYSNPEDSAAIKLVTDWAAGPNTGDRSDLPGPVPDRIWGLFSVGPEDCLGSSCKQYADCPSVKARNLVNQSHLLVTNYHVLLSDVLYDFLPQYETVVLDEGHRMADIARSFFGFEVHEGMVRYAIKNFDPQNRHRLNVESALLLFFSEVREYFNSDRYNVRLREPPMLPSVGSLVGNLRAAASFLVSMAAGTDEDAKEMRRELENQRQRLAFLASKIEEFVILHVPGMVYFLEEDNKRRLKLMAKKINVAEDLYEKLFKDTNAIVTSATLTVNNKFGHIIDELGLDEPKVFVTDTPFNWKDQAVLVVPKDFTSPSDRGFKDDVGRALVSIVKMAKGRTLALFTSRAGMDTAYGHLVRAGLPYKILRQSDGQKNELVKEFTRDTSSVLLGLASFWEGVDVPGESLSCVVMDKIPFPLKDDPVLDALEDLGSNAFHTYSIPRAVIAFKQGFGRLIRTSTDKGVVVLLDNRIHTKWKIYGYKFLESLPPEVHRSSNLNDIAKILE